MQLDWSFPLLFLVMCLSCVQVMVANAGMVQVKALTELTSAEFSREINVNLVGQCMWPLGSPEVLLNNSGVFHQYAAAARQMIKQGEHLTEFHGLLKAVSKGSLQEGVARSWGRRRWQPTEALP